MRTKFRTGEWPALLLAVVVAAAGCSSTKSMTSPPEPSMAGASATGDAGAAGASESATCEQERAALERKMADELDAAAEDPDVTSQPNFTLALETGAGYRFVHSHGDSSLDTSYESASTSKWIAASVILDLVDEGVLSLTDEPGKYLAFWQAKGVTLAQLLSFTSGFSEEPLCLNLPKADFAACVEQAYNLNVDSAPGPGTEFYYSSVHLQIAGLMAVEAANAASFHELFAAWQAKTGLFPDGDFDLPSRDNPRLAGGMHWTGNDYLGFLRAMYDGQLLRDDTRHAMLSSQRGAAKVVGSPTLDALGQDWAYGFGNWIECPSALGPDTFDCDSKHRNSSPGAYGAYPFIDWDERYFGLLARQGKLGTFRDGDALFGVVSEDATRWARLCRP